MIPADIISYVVRELRREFNLERYFLRVYYFATDVLLGAFVPLNTDSAEIDINGDFDLLFRLSPRNAEAALVYMTSHEMRHFWQFIQGWDWESEEAEDDAEEFSHTYTKRWFERKGIYFDPRELDNIHDEMFDLLEAYSSAVSYKKVVLLFFGR